MLPLSRHSARISSSDSAAQSGSWTIASATAARNPDTWGNLLLQSGSFVFTDIGSDHGGGPAFDPVVKFMNRYRARPRRIADLNTASIR